MSSISNNASFDILQDYIREKKFVFLKLLISEMFQTTQKRKRKFYYQKTKQNNIEGGGYIFDFACKMGHLIGKHAPSRFSYKGRFFLRCKSEIRW